MTANNKTKKNERRNEHKKREKIHTQISLLGISMLNQIVNIYLIHSNTLEAGSGVQSEEVGWWLGGCGGGVNLKIHLRTLSKCPQSFLPF